MSTGTPATPAILKSIPINQLQPNPWNRTQFSADQMESLIRSIQARGIETRLLVRPKGERFEIVDGERRWRAARKAGLTEVPCEIRDYSDEQVAVLDIVTNAERENLSLLEKGGMIQNYMTEFHKKQHEAAETFGMTEPEVSELLSFQALDPQLKKFAAANFSRDDLRTLKKLPPDLQLQVALELETGSLKPEDIQKRCSQLRFTPKKTSAKALGESTDPLADVWTKAGAGETAGWEMGYNDHVWTLKMFGPEERFRLYLKDTLLKLAESIGDVEQERQQQKKFSDGMNAAFTPEGDLLPTVTEAMQKYQQTLPPDQAKEYQAKMDELKAAQAAIADPETEERRIAKEKVAAILARRKAMVLP